MIPPESQEEFLEAMESCIEKPAPKITKVSFFKLAWALLSSEEIFQDQSPHDIKMRFGLVEYYEEVANAVAESEDGYEKWFNKIPNRRDLSEDMKDILGMEESETMERFAAICKVLRKHLK